MKTRYPIFLLLQLALIFSLTAGPAYSDPGGKHGRGHHEKQHHKKEKQHSKQQTRIVYVERDRDNNEWWRHLDRVTTRGRFFIPPRHRPPPGLCRIWYPGTAPGRQPAAVPCSAIRIKPKSYVLYNDYGYDPYYFSEYSQPDMERELPHALLDIVLDQVSRR